MFFLKSSKRSKIQFLINRGTLWQVLYEKIKDKPIDELSHFCFALKFNKKRDNIYPKIFDINENCYVDVIHSVYRVSTLNRFYLNVFLRTDQHFALLCNLQVVCRLNHSMPWLNDALSSSSKHSWLKLWRAPTACKKTFTDFPNPANIAIVF